MEISQVINKNMKVEIPSEAMPQLTRQPSATKNINNNNNCLCSPTSHAGSFRCRLHRAPNLQRTKSIDSATKVHATTDDPAS